jgi:copper chaperone NosL
MRLAVGLVALVCAVLAACSGGEQQTAAVPREPGSEATGYYCGMTLKEHQGPKGQILLKTTDAPLWFSSVRDAMTYVEQDLTSERDLAGFWVNDMAQGAWEAPAPGSWIDARTAWYVVGSKKTAAMGGSEAVPFKERTAAEAFARDYNGHVSDYLAARREVADAPAASADGGGGT